MRLQKISTSYPSYLTQFYSHRPDLATQSYDSQYAALMNDCGGWADFWGHALAKLGIETSEVLASAEPMQRRWAAEHGTKFKESSWFYDILRAQIQSFQPDVLFVEDYASFAVEFIEQLKSDCPSLRLILGWCGAPSTSTRIFSTFDVVLSNIPRMVQFLRDSGHRAYHINHAFEPRVLERINLEASPSVEVAFFGSISKKNAFHNDREKLLLALTEKTNIQIWADINQVAATQRRGVLIRQFAFDTVQGAQRIGVSDKLLRKIPVINRISTWEARPELDEKIDPRLVQRANPPLFGLAMFQQLHDTKIAVNTHIDASSESASNMRLYEATGVGCCLLTDEKKNLSELFEPGIEVVTYSSPEDCVEKIRYLQSHEEERQRIAAAGQKRTLRDHSFDKRSEQLCEIIEESFKHAAK